MLEDLQRNLPNLIKSYPSSNPLMSQKNLAAVLHVNPEHLIIGNGATELIALINMTLIDRIAVPIPTFGEYIEKMKDQRDAELYALDPEHRYELRLDRLSCLGAPAQARVRCWSSTRAIPPASLSRSKR